MTIIKSKTINAVGYERGGMFFDHVLHDDGLWYVHYSQSYFFVDENGDRVDLADYGAVSGVILDTDLQQILPDIWNSLVFLWTWFDDRIQEQENMP
jgi:hypothetical protein